MKIIVRGMLESIGEEDLKDYIMRTEGLSKEDLPICIRYRFMGILKSNIKGATLLMCTKDVEGSTMGLTESVDSAVILWPHVICKSNVKRIIRDSIIDEELLNNIEEEENIFRDKNRRALGAFINKKEGELK